MMRLQRETVVTNPFCQCPGEAFCNNHCLSTKGLMVMDLLSVSCNGTQGFSSSVIDITGRFATYFGNLGNMHG